MQLFSSRRPITEIDLNQSIWRRERNRERATRRGWMRRFFLFFESVFCFCFWNNSSVAYSPPPSSLVSTSGLRAPTRSCSSLGQSSQLVDLSGDMWCQRGAFLSVLLLWRRKLSHACILYSTLPKNANKWILVQTVHPLIGLFPIDL